MKQAAAAAAAGLMLLKVVRGCNGTKETAD